MIFECVTHMIRFKNYTVKSNQCLQNTQLMLVIITVM